MNRYGTLGRDVGRVGRVLRFGWGGLILVGVSLSLLETIGEHRDPAGFALQTAIYLGLIVAAYLAAYLALGERLLARGNAWLNTAILVLPAILVAWWNVSVGNLVGVDLPASLSLGMGIYIGASLALEAAIGYGGCEVIALPIAIWGRRYVSYCIPIVVLDAAERGVVDAASTRWRAAWTAVAGIALLALVTIAVGLVPTALYWPITIATGVAVLALVILQRRDREQRLVSGPPG